ncbi:S41 family peptidase [Tepidimicrobium xylanilyticum]|uniref:C-terminal processing peptidase-3. Serine peptidase. MEROPS family S41A n=1 Tax=Tepidimicrobium xylanilyticum TaxID=1123352 RepID=A0A1H2V0N8_9FIRM|nr:S41 family peptidase [Tepidimicrobium xylanilyticum]GMG96764.1 peptidase S41 [Tepidimicrobium xylanilyticum]SDW61875.1 C-terminal processing peptidase-3. Serine peptidase. MEROPS family S41A [Tepidimicrobium xylanilyticum]
MSKKRNITLVIILIIFTNIITFGATNLLTIRFKDRVILPASEYEQLMSSYRKYSKVMGLENYIKDNYLKVVDEDKLMEGQLKGLFQALEDPYSVYMTEDEFKSFTEQTQGIYGGIGVIVTPGEDNLITVVSPIEGTPGERAGIKTGDKIIKVNGEEFTADRMDQAVKLMKGEPKTKVNITILRKDKDGKNEYIDLEIIREEIRLETVKSDIIQDNIGYIKITSFDELTYDDFKKDLNNLMNKDIAGIIIDLRNNPGGLLNVCVDIADELLGEGVIVYTETRHGERVYERSDKRHVDIPLVVLVNEGSASASEILAGAIKDHNRGILIGSKTFGKGVVQRIRELSDGSGFKLTVSEYFTPNGTNIHGVGIEPDIVVDLPEDIQEIGVENLKEDTQLQKAIEKIKDMIQ